MAQPKEDTMDLIGVDPGKRAINWAVFSGSGLRLCGAEKWTDSDFARGIPGALGGVLHAVAIVLRVRNDGDAERPFGSCRELSSVCTIGAEHSADGYDYPPKLKVIIGGQVSHGLNDDKCRPVDQVTGA